MNRTISKYLSRKIKFDNFIISAPSHDLGIIVVIPSFNEKSITETLIAISVCDYPNCDVEVIVSINAAANSSEEILAINRETYNIVAKFDKHPNWITFHAILNNELPTKKAGVGLGRKIGMDEAIKRFMHLEKENGIIVCFDADSKCTTNYLYEIQDFFKTTNFKSCSINYEHPIDGEEFTDETYNSIIHYELHLRYYIAMQKWCGLPFAMHTVGSSMACTVDAYCAIGGMNQRKAGEDFYFIHKLIKYGYHGELNSTSVIPSPRISDRVPFGTGRAVGEMIEGKKDHFYTYNPRSFESVKWLYDNLNRIYEQDQDIQEQLPISIKSFFKISDTFSKIVEIKNNTSDFKNFERQFWQYFDAFQLMKYLHYLRVELYPDVPVVIAINQSGIGKSNDAKKLLIELRR
ncbi:MAG: glycosyltransferase family 2 protein [Saprospiraceae bacterium]